MTNFYIGQKVRYLNQVGQGTIKKITGETALVEDNSGFEMPFATKELVPANKDEIIVNQTTNVSSNSTSSNLESNVAKKYLTNGVYLIFAPLKSQNLDVILVNNSGYDISINIYLTDKNTNTFIKNLFITSEQLKHIKEVHDTEIGDWQHISCQIMFSKNSIKAIPSSATSSKKIDGKKFFDEQNYVLTPYHQLPVYDLCIYSESMKEEDVLLDSDGLKKLYNQKENSSPTKVSIPHHFKQHELEKEVDLHIEELVENYNIYTPAALLQIQMNKFKDELSKAMAIPIQKITFIHGVGKGTLKQEIINYLSTIDGIKFFDGALSKYGYGATTVEIV